MHHDGDSEHGQVFLLTPRNVSDAFSHHSLAIAFPALSPGWASGPRVDPSGTWELAADPLRLPPCGFALGGVDRVQRSAWRGKLGRTIRSNGLGWTGHS
jgi:hypothetical protein